MPPKKPQVQRPDTKSRAETAVDEAPLQAVILADSYNRRFEVLCSDQPRVLLPLCSAPLLAWTLECLSISKVKQVFVFCGVHADKIRDYVATSPYRHTLDIQCLSSTTARTAGDALRELDAMSVLNAENPFILVHSPIVANYDISKMVDGHKARRETDKNFIMTMGVGRGGRPHPESAIMLTHPASSRLLHYVQTPIAPRPKRVQFPAHFFKDPYPANMTEFEVWSGSHPASEDPRGGYRDLGVDICEADVPALCTENFDYHDLRRHFLNGVLTSELLGKKIAVHVAGDEVDDPNKGDLRCGDGGKYIERVRDTRTFGEITRDVLRRWTFPLVPDLNEPGGVQYELRRGNVYVARDNVVLSRTTTLNGPLLIGPRTALAQGTKVDRSTIGADCSLGPNTVVVESHIFDDVRIGANCTLDNCMIGRNVEIADNVKIGRGVLLGDGVKLGKGVNIPDFHRVGRERFLPEYYDDEDEVEGEEEKTRRLEVLGEESIGYLWPMEEAEVEEDSDDDEDDLEPFEHPKNKRLLQLGRSLDDLSDDDDTCSTLSAASSDTGSPSSLASDESLPDIPSLALDVVDPMFHREAAASLARAFEEEHSVENARLELRTLVMGYNAGIDAAREECTNFLMSQTEISPNPAAILASVTKIWTRWGELVTSHASDTTNIPLDVQQYCVKNEGIAPYFGIVLRGLYESDVIAEEDLLEWRELSSAQGEGIKDETEKKAWKDSYAKGKVYVDVLEDMDSESEEDDDEEGEDEEEDSD